MITPPNNPVYVSFNEVKNAFLPMLRKDETISIEIRVKPDYSKVINFTLKTVKVFLGKQTCFTSICAVYAQMLEDADSLESNLAYILRLTRKETEEKIEEFLAGNNLCSELLKLKLKKETIGDHQPYGSSIHGFFVDEMHNSSEHVFRKAAKNLPGMNLIVEKCPACKTGTMKMTLLVAVTHLNDKHDWTREKIAEWIENHFDEVPYFEREGNDADNTED